MEPPSFPSTGTRVARAAPGSDAAIALPLPSGSPPFHFEWSRAGAKLDDRFKPTHDAGGVRLTISAARTGDSGVYTLQATNAAGKDSTRVRLEVSPDEEPIGDDPPAFLRRLQDLTVKVGTRTRFLVEIVSSTECRVTWYRNERRLLEAERIALVRDGNFWCADVSAVSVDDAGRWTCTAENVGGRASCSAHLNVLVPKAYKRPEFVEELRALLTEQGTVSLECKVVGVPTPVLRWFKDSCEIKAGDVFALTANADDPTSLGTYTCEAVNCMGRAYSSSKVHVIGRASREGSARPTSGVAGLEPPPIFTKELEDQFVRICEPLTLSCNIVVPPWPRSIVWYNKEGKVEPSNKYRIQEDGVGGYLLEVPSAEWQDEGEWKCVATSSGGRIGISTCYVSMDVPKNYRKPRFMENLQAVLTEEGLVSFECKVVGFPTPVLSWFKDGQELKPGDVYQLTGTNSLGSYCCIAKNCMGQTSSSAELTVEDIQNQLNEEEKLQLFTKNQAPKFLQGLKSVEAKIDEPFRFTIRVAIPPEPTVSWYRDDQPVDESSRCHHGKEERGVFFLDIKSLEFMDQAEWKCVAMNDFGHSVTSCFLKLIIPRHYKKPRFLENLQAILSDEGAVNLECKVIGVPQPVLKWYKDGEELKPGDIHRIISGQDGTCCLGTYTCEAQNCMGIAASSASLLGFEDSVKAKSKNKVDEQTLQRNLSLSTIHEERTSQMYDTPVGDITLDDKGEISFSFDGKEVSVSLYETPDLTEEEALQIVEMYADQLSENVTEHNVVELPPLRFVKETSTSGNLLMEAIIIDVSPEYFTSPEEDLRTEADIEDISIADENGPPQLSLDQELDGEDYLEKTMALLSEEKADFPKKSDRKKSDSHKSGDDYFSLSRDQSLSEEKKDDDTQVLSESDLQSFASARSNGKPKSKSSKPSIDDGQESSDITRTVLLKEDLQTICQFNELESNVKNKRERRSRSARRSSSGSDKMREVLESNFDNTLIKDIFQQENFLEEINSISLSLTKVINGVQMIERDTILKSELMSSAATAARSLEIITNFITPLIEIQSIIKAIGESESESHEVTTSLFNKLPQSINNLYQTLTIIEKCMDVESENKTLVKKTCTNIIDKCGEELNKLFTEINSIVNKVTPYLDDICVVSIQSTTNKILKTIRSSEEVLKESKKFTDKSETKLDKVTPETKHLQKTQKAVYELRNPLKSLLYIAEEVDISSFISAENITSQIILNDMSIPIQDLQNALEQIENLSVSETQSDLQQYNTEIIETVMDSVLKLRSSFEQLSVKAVMLEKEEVLSKALLDIKHYIIDISNHLDKFEAKFGQFNILQSENKLEALQKMAQILINLENNVGMFDFASSLKAHMTTFHKNLTKVLEHVIESNDANKYFAFLDICDVVNRLNTVIKNVDSNDMLSLAGISNNLKTIQAIISKNEFTPELNFSITSNITELLTHIHETINYADTSSYSMISENVEDLSIRQLEEEKLNIMLEHIEKAISLTSNIVSFETTKDLVIQQSLTRIIPTLEEIKYSVALLNETEQEENISDLRIFSFTQAVANPLCDLNIGISVLNQVICEKTSDRVEINKLKAELGTPLVEIRNAIEILQQDVISQNIDNINDVNVTIADVVQSVQSCIIMIQEQDVLENADELSTLEDISAIKTSAEILGCDRDFVSPIIQEIFTNFNDQETYIVHVQPMQSATTETLRDLNDHILMLQTPEIIETINTLSNNPDYSNVKSVTTELDKVHCAVESILHPVTIDESQNLVTSVSTSQLAALVQPLEELYHALVIIDMANQPMETGLLLDKIEFFLKNISTLENKVRKTLDYLHVAIETADLTLDISTKIRTLHLLCEQLKIVLETVKNDVFTDKLQLVLLHDSVSTYLDVTSCLEGINIVQVKLSLERLHQIIITVQDKVLSCAQEKPPVIKHENKILRLLEDIKNAIASLAETDFVDILVPEQEDQEGKYEKLNKIESIVEKLAYSVQNVPESRLNNNLEPMKDKIVETCNDEMSLLCSLLKQKITPRCIIKILQVFYDLCQNLEELQLHENQSSSVSEDLSEWMINSKESLKNVQALIFQAIDSQSYLIYDNPISNIKTDESVLNKILEMNENANLCNFVNLLMDSMKIIKPWFGNMQAEVLKELESCGKINLDEDVDVDTLYDVLEKCLSKNVHSENVEYDHNLEEIYKVVQTHSDCKRVKGSAKKIIFINCVSDCLHILKQKFVESSERLIGEESAPQKQELKNILAELSEPFETFHSKITNICDQNMGNIEKGNILKELESLQVPLETIQEVTKKAEKNLEIENLPINTDTIIIAKDLLTKINSAHNNFKQLENILGSIDMIINKKTIEEMEIILSTVLSKEVICKENEQLAEKTDSFLQHMEHYIEVIEIVEETCAVLKLDDFKKSADIVRELRENLISESSPDINIGDSQQMQLVQNLQNALTSLQAGALESKQELAAPISDDVRQQIVTAVSELQNDLIAITSVVEENSEIVETGKKIDGNDQIMIQDEESLLSSQIVKQNDQYDIIDLDENIQEKSLQTYSDIVDECPLPEILQNEEHLINSDDFNTLTTEVLCENKIKENNRENIQEPLKLNIDTEFEDNKLMKLEEIKESLVQHINYYLSENLIQDITKLLSSENFELLEQSIQIAKEVRDTAVVENNTSSLNYQEFLKQHLCLVVKLQELMVTINHKNINNAFSQSNVKFAVNNLLDCLKLYAMSLNNISEAKHISVDNKILVENKFNETQEDFTKTKVIIGEENISVSEESKVDIPRENINFGETLAEETDIDMRKQYEKINTEFDKSESNTVKNLVTEESKEGTITEDNQLDKEMFPTNVHGMHVNAENKSEAECTTKDYDQSNDVNVVRDKTNIIEETTSFQDENILAREEFSIEEKQSSIHELETLLQEVNETLDLSLNNSSIYNSDELQDTLEEVQTVIMKLKCEFDGSTNDVLNECIEDLECNVRSVQLQINENSPPELLNEECMNLQTLVTAMDNIFTQTKLSESPANNALCICTNDIERSIDLLDEIPDSNVDFQLDNIILSLNEIKDTMKSLKVYFSSDAETLILRGIEVTHLLNLVEDKVFALEKDLDANSKIDTTFRDGMVSAIHSIYGSISNMRGTISSIQKRYMYENYGQPSDNFLKSIKNVNLILNYEGKEEWKQFAKSLRKVLNHFEDIKFYINFDKTARLPSDSTFTKIILGELNTVLSEVVLHMINNSNEVSDAVQHVVSYVRDILYGLENQTALEVKEKIPIFKELSNRIVSLTNTIKNQIKENKDTKNKSSDNVSVVDKIDDIVIKISTVERNEKDSTAVTVSEKLLESDDTAKSDVDSKNVSFKILEESSKGNNDTLDERLSEVTNDQQKNNVIETPHVNSEEKNNGHATHTESKITKSETADECKDTTPEQKNAKIINFEPTQDIVPQDAVLNEKKNNQDIQITPCENIGTTVKTGAKELQINIQNEQEEVKLIDDSNSGVSSFTDNINNKNDDEEVRKNMKDSITDEENINREVISLDDIKLQESITDQKEKCAEIPHSLKSNDDVVIDTEYFPDEIGDTTLDVQEIECNKHEDDTTQHEIITKYIITKPIENENKEEEITNQHEEDIPTKPEAVIEKQVDQHSILEQINNQENARNNVKEADHIVLDHPNEEIISLDSNNLKAEQIVSEEIKEEKCFGTEFKPDIAIIAKSQNEENKTEEYKMEEVTLPQNVELKYADDINLETSVKSYENNKNSQSVQSEKENELLGIEKLVTQCMEENIVDTEKEKNDNTAAIRKITLDQTTEGLAETIIKDEEPDKEKSNDKASVIFTSKSKDLEISNLEELKLQEITNKDIHEQDIIDLEGKKLKTEYTLNEEDDKNIVKTAQISNLTECTDLQEPQSSPIKIGTKDTITRTEEGDSIVLDEVTGKLETKNEINEEEISEDSIQQIRAITEADAKKEICIKETFITSELHDKDISNKKQEESQSNLQKKIIEGIDPNAMKTCEVSGIDDKNNVEEKQHWNTKNYEKTHAGSGVKNYGKAEYLSFEEEFFENRIHTERDPMDKASQSIVIFDQQEEPISVPTLKMFKVIQDEVWTDKVNETKPKGIEDSNVNRNLQNVECKTNQQENIVKIIDNTNKERYKELASEILETVSIVENVQGDHRKDEYETVNEFNDFSSSMTELTKLTHNRNEVAPLIELPESNKNDQQYQEKTILLSKEFGNVLDDQSNEQRIEPQDHKQTTTDLIPLGEEIPKHSEHYLRDNNVTMAINDYSENSLQSVIKEIECAVPDEEIDLSKQHGVCMENKSKLEDFKDLSKTNDAETEKKIMPKEDVKEKLKVIEHKLTLDNQTSQIEITAQNEALCIKKDGKSSLSEMDVVQEIKTIIPVNRNEENVHEEQVQQQEITEKNEKDVQLCLNSKMLEIIKDEDLRKTNDAETEKKTIPKEDVKEKLKNIEHKLTLDNQTSRIEMTAQNEALCTKKDGKSSLSEIDIVQEIKTVIPVNRNEENVHEEQVQQQEITERNEKDVQLCLNSETIEIIKDEDLSKTNDAETEKRIIPKEEVKEKLKDIEHKLTLDNQTSQIKMTAQNEALCIKKDGKISHSEIDIVQEIKTVIPVNRNGENVHEGPFQQQEITERNEKDVQLCLNSETLEIIKDEDLGKTNDAEMEKKSIPKEDVKEKLKDIGNKLTIDNQISQIEKTAQNEKLCLKRDGRSSLSEMDIVQEIKTVISVNRNEENVHEEQVQQQEITERNEKDVQLCLNSETLEIIKDKDLSKTNDAETENKIIPKEEVTEKLNDIEHKLTLDNQISKNEMTAQNEALSLKKDRKSSLLEMDIVQDIKTVIPVNRNEENVHEEQVQQQEITERNEKDVQLGLNSEILEIIKDEKTNVHVNKTLKVLSSEKEYLQEETKNQTQETTQKNENVEENEIEKKAASKKNQKDMNSETSAESNSKLEELDSSTNQNLSKINDNTIINLENVENKLDTQSTLETVQILKENIFTTDQSQHLTPLVESIINNEIGTQINQTTNKEEESAVEEVLLDDLHKDKNILKDEKEDKETTSIKNGKKIKRKSANIKKISKKVDTIIAEKDVGQLPSETTHVENEGLIGKGKEDERRISIYEEELSYKFEDNAQSSPDDKQISEQKQDDQRNLDLFMREKSNLQKIIDTKNCDKDQKLDDKEVKKTQKNIEYEIIKSNETFCDESKLHQEETQKSKIDIQGRVIIGKTEPGIQEVNRDQKIKQHPLFVDRSEPDYELEFARPSSYTTKQFDTDQSLTEFKASGKSPTIYKTQTLLHEAQLKSSVPPYLDRQSLDSVERAELKQKSKTRSEARNIVSEKRGSFPRDVKRKPVFSTHLTDRTAVEGSRVKLTCSILSSTDPVIHWYKNGTLLDNKQKCRTKHVDGLITMEILNAVPSDSGEYSCTVENEYGSITSSANLKVYPGFEASPIPPTFTRSIRDMYHSHENELILECRIRGQPLPIITWLKDNKPITLNERYQAHYLADGVSRLTISSPTEDDSGKYTCKAENSMWSDQISHDVHFTSKKSCHIKNIATTENIRINRQPTDSRRPHFTNVLSDHKVVSGGTIGLQVEISGSPTRVEWLREGRSVTETYRNAQTYTDHGLYTLALPDVTEKESGLYTCRAWSTHGAVDMNASVIVVQPNQYEGKPATIISRPAKDLLISNGEDLNVSFRVRGEPKPKVFFMKGIRDITNSQRVCKMTSDDYVKFTLKRSVVSDAGTYCVFVRNAYGCDRAFVTVVIRQRASSENLISDWTYPMDDLAISVVERNYKSVPDRIPSEPTTVDGGSNWVALAWPKPESQVKAPILAYKVESWLLGKEGGARWIELGITPRNSFDAFNLKQGEEYHFRVTPRNRYGWGESVQTSTPICIGLTGDRPEFIEILPGQLKVLVGETASLYCSFKGNPMPEIMWMKNGHEIEEETERVTVELNDNNTSLRINNIRIEDEGRYSCEATNIHGRSSTYSRMAVITDKQIWEADAKLKRERSAGENGEYPPQFTMRLRDRRVQATYPVRLTCQVIGSPRPTVTWFKNGEEVSVDKRHTTSQDEYFYTLEIAPTTLEDGGVYEAMARNGFGAISCRCNLVVDKGIRAYIAPEFCCGFEPLYRVCEGDELRISAVVEAYPSVGVTWYRDGVRLRPSRRAVMTLDRDGQTELAVASVAARDAGVYTCTASNEVGRASTSGKVEVIKGEHTAEIPKVPPIVISRDLPYSKEPMFIRKPRSSEAREGDTVIIECEVIGDPKPDVYWLRDFLKPDYYRDASHFKRVGAGPAYRFEIPHAKFDYTGAYSIVAKNIHGEAKAIISLQILAKDITCTDDTHNIRYGRVETIPHFEKELTDLLCYDGDAIEFECRVSGNPEPDIRWFHYTEVIPDSTDFETSYDLGTSRLKIKQVTAEDEGTYTCEASNNMGKATSSACLVIYPPGEPNTLSQRLRRPPALMSASSTPRSTPRTTPARSLSRTPGPDLRRLGSPSREIAPKFYTYPYNRVVEEGDTVVFQCAVRGLPPPWATWDKDGVIITPTSRISIREKDDMFRILEIEQVSIEDVGLYRVTLENDYGRAEASARLEVITQMGKFYGSRSYSVSPRKCLSYRRRTPSITRQD